MNTAGTGAEPELSALAGEVRRPDPAGVRALLDGAIVRYALAVASVVLATASTFEINKFTIKPLTFPFYAAVVVSAWLGAGPGLVAIALSVLVVAYFWASPYYSFWVQAAELPWFLCFVSCMAMSFAWSWQRRRAQSALEITVRQRTTDLLRANAALQAEMAERDRSERALRDAEAELTRTLRLATMAELAAAIAHEINQPLAAITANAGACVRSLTRDLPLLDNAREAAECIVADGHRAGDVIARVRALFNHEPPRKQRLNVNDAIRRVLDLSRAAIERQDVAVDDELAVSEPLVMADPVQLQQVIINLVTNALEAMSADGGEPRRLTVRTTIEDGLVRAAVEDTGQGLDAEQAGRIFDSFYTTKPGGIGLGLAISRSIIDAHDGSMWAKPKPDRGASLGFALPLASPE